MLDLLSYFGMIMLLLALLLNRKKHILSDLLNFLGSVFLTIWAVIFSAWAIFFLDLTWSGISIVNLIKDFRTWIAKYEEDLAWEHKRKEFNG